MLFVSQLLHKHYLDQNIVRLIETVVFVLLFTLKEKDGWEQMSMQFSG